MYVPNAKEMAEKTFELVNSKLNVLLKKVNEALEKAPGYSVLISISAEDEKMIDAATERLQELGYKVKYTPGYYEDRPCGGHVNGKLELDWSHEKANVSHGNSR